MKKAFQLTLLLIVFIPDFVWGLHPFVRNYSHKMTKAGTQNWDIIQHDNDWMYFANNEGLLEFDGLKWTLYPIRNHTNIRSLHYDNQKDRIYAGAYNEFGYYSRDERGLLKYHSLVDGNTLSKADFNEIWNIRQLENTVYFQGDRDIFQYKNDEIRHFGFNTKIDCSQVVFNSFIVANSVTGIFMVNGDLFIPLPGSDILKNKKVCAILPFKDKKILFVTDFHGLYIFDTDKVTPFNTDIDVFMHENQVFCAAIQDNKLAIGTVLNGLVVKDFNDNSNIYSNIYFGMQNNTVLSLGFDSNHNLWLGLDKGIDYLLLNSPVYDIFGNNQQFGSGYSSLMRDKILYLGTNQGLYTTSYPIKNSPYPLHVNLMPKMQGQVWCLTEIDNTLFCGNDHGAYIIDNHNAEQIEGIPGTWNFKEMHQYPGYILGSSYQGFFILKKVNGQWKFSNFIKGFGDSGALFEEDENGNIWFSHWVKGIAKLTINEKLDSITSVEYLDSTKGFVNNRNNTLCKINEKMLFSSSGGFFRYDSQKNKMEHADDIEKILGVFENPLRLFESPQKDIWYTSGDFLGVALFQRDSSYKLDYSTFSILKNKLIPGFEHFDFVDNSNMIASTQDGFAWINTRYSIPENGKKRPRVSIQYIYITNQHDSIASGYLTKQIVIPEFANKYNSIRLEFVAPEYRDENMVMYRYKLEGYDIEWSTYSFSTTKEYTKLPKGNYVFKVQAKSMLEFDIAETRYEFVILPPWYDSLVAWIAYIALFCFTLLQVFLFIKRHSEKGILKIKAEKEKELQEKEKQFEAEKMEKVKEINTLKNNQLKYELRHKSQELANSTMNLIRKNEILLEMNRNLEKINSDIQDAKEVSGVLKRLSKMQDEIKKNIGQDDNWKKFEKNFDLVYENYLKRLSEEYPDLTINDKKLCAYLKMGLSSKDIAPLMNLTFRSVEMSRYRLRNKLNLSREANLTEYLQKF